MKRRVFALRFTQAGGIAYAEDQHLHQLVVLWAETHLSSPVNFSDYLMTWAECSADDKGIPSEVHGVVCLQRAIDVPVFRFTDQRSAKSLIDRANNWLADQGAMNQRIMVRIGLSDEQVCPNADEWIKAMGCTQAERFLYKVR